MFFSPHARAGRRSSLPIGRVPSHSSASRVRLHPLPARCRAPSGTNVSSTSASPSPVCIPPPSGAEFVRHATPPPGPRATQSAGFLLPVTLRRVDACAIAVCRPSAGPAPRQNNECLATKRSPSPPSMPTVSPVAVQGLRRSVTPACAASLAGRMAAEVTRPALRPDPGTTTVGNAHPSSAGGEMATSSPGWFIAEDRPPSTLPSAAARSPHGARTASAELPAADTRCP